MVEKLLFDKVELYEMLVSGGGGKIKVEALIVPVKFIDIAEAFTKVDWFKPDLSKLMLRYCKGLSSSKFRKPLLLDIGSKVRFSNLFLIISRTDTIEIDARISILNIIQ